MDNQKKIIGFRATAEEKAELKRKVKQARMTQEEFLRRMIDEKEIVQLDGIEELIHEMKKQGVNLNQLAKYANANGGIDREKYDKTMQEVVEVWRLLRLWLDTHR